MYNLNNFNTLAICDATKTKAAEHKTNLEMDKLSLEKQLSTTGSSATSLPNQLEANNQRLINLTAYYNSLEAGQEKNDTKTAMNLTENKIFSITKRLERQGPDDLSEAEFELNCVIQNLAEVGTWISAIDAKRAELVTAGIAA